jgi:hypothetical protein
MARSPAFTLVVGAISQRANKAPRESKGPLARPVQPAREARKVKPAGSCDTYRG